MIDQRGKLMEKPFDYRVFKNQNIEITWENKTVVLVKGQRAIRLLAQLQAADEQGVQLILAKVTGNFKRGNEKSKPLALK